ncbi:MAG: methyltransferase domain-containing protein [Dehalococcoidales bacterium]|nr:methyltransferase domain-containing protein [Dehalococcoidales bacterium]
MHLSVVGLGDNTTEDELMELFSKIGTVTSVKVIRNINTGQSKRFAIIQMPVDAEGQEAIRILHGSVLADEKLTIFRVPQILPGEMEFRTWLNDNANILLQRIGIRHDQTVMDLGCGPGIFSMACAEIVGRNGNVFACDTRSKTLERLKEIASKKGLENIETMLLDKSGMPIALANESVDVILLYDVLQEIDDKLELLEELHRILKQDGFLSIFPMHMGTEKCLAIINSLGIFQFRDSYCPSGLQSSSEIINFKKVNASRNN